VLAHGVDHLQSAITPQTAMVYTTWRDERLPNTLKITRAAGVPLLLDDAAGIPPFENFRRYRKRLASIFIALAAERVWVARNVLGCC